MTADNHFPTKSALLGVIKTERTQFESIIQGLTDSQLTEPGVEASWSIIDILAHISAWERLAFDRIHAALSGEPLKFPLIHGDAELDAFNAEVYEMNKIRALVDVIRDFNDSHRDLLKQIKDLNDDFLTTHLQFEWAGKLSAQLVISANTLWHYLEYSDSITRWLEKQA